MSVPRTPGHPTALPSHFLTVFIAHILFTSEPWPPGPTQNSGWRRGWVADSRGFFGGFCLLSLAVLLLTLKAWNGTPIYLFVKETKIVASVCSASLVAQSSIEGLYKAIQGLSRRARY